MTHKECTKCREEKPLSDFGTYKNQKYREGKKMAQCKECMKIAHKEWVENNKARFRQYQKEYKRNKKNESNRVHN
jgi:Zn-finger protein